MTLLRRTPMERTLPDFKTCAHCERVFVPERPLQAVCGRVCAGRKAKADRLEAVKVERVRTKARKEAIKTIPELIKAAQVSFNAFIRARDEKASCICCGRTADDGNLLTGSRWDCGHYRSTGSASHLRFNEDNAHRQLVVCNRHGAGRAVDYRIGLIARIGLDRVEALESNNEVHKWTREELIEIKALYVAKLKELKARAE